MAIHDQVSTISHSRTIQEQDQYRRKAFFGHGGRRPLFLFHQGEDDGSTDDQCSGGGVPAGSQHQLCEKDDPSGRAERRDDPVTDHATGKVVGRQGSGLRTRKKGKGWKMMTQTEQLRQIVTFRALTTFEQDLAEAIKPFQQQLTALQRERGDFLPHTYAERELQLKERLTRLVDEVRETWETKVDAFLKVAGRDTAPRYPVKDTNRALVLLTQLGVLSVQGGVNLLQPLIDQAETNADNQDVRALIQSALPILKDKLAMKGTGNADLAVSEPDPVAETIGRAEAALRDDQMERGAAGIELAEALRSQVTDVIDQVSRTGSVEDRIVGIAPGGEEIQRPRRRDLIPAEGINTPELIGGRDVILTPQQAGNHKVHEDSVKLAAEQGGDRTHLVPDVGQYWRLVHYYHWTACRPQVRDSALVRFPPVQHPSRLAHRLEVDVTKQWLTNSEEGQDKEKGSAVLQLIENQLFGVIARLASVNITPKPIPELACNESAARLIAQTFPQSVNGTIPDGIL